MATAVIIWVRRRPHAERRGVSSFPVVAPTFSHANAELDKEYVYTIEHEVNVVNLSQSGCGVNKIDERKTDRDWDPRTHELTAIDWDPRTHEGLVMIDSGASVHVCPKWFGNSRLEQSDGATCLRGANGKPLQEYGKRQIYVTKPILSVSCLCENGVETHLAKESFLRFGDGHENLMGDRKNSQKTDAYKLMDSQ